MSDVAIPKRKKLVRRNETRDLTKPIEAALNAVPGVWCARNTVGFGYHANGDPVTWGLGDGSPDLIVEADGRLLWLEVKWPGEGLRPSQRDWHDGHRKRCPDTKIVVVGSVEEAVAAVEDWRMCF